jgi:hypothetical protein
MLQDSLVEGWASGTTPLTESDVNEISKFKAWYLAWTKNRDNNLSNFLGIFTEDMWDTYFPSGDDAVQDDLGLHGRSEEVEERNNFKVKADLKQFRRFTGLIDDYVPWKRATRAVATAQGMGELLEDSYTVPEEGEEGFKIFTQKNALLHSALTMSTADSSATLKVEKFRLTADGRGAWMALRDWYEGQGSNESVAKRAMKILHSSKLTSATPNGADGYIQIFEQALQDLEETKHYYDPTMKKIMFLDNIQDEAYKIIVEMLKLDSSKTYDDCIIEIRRRSVDVEKDRKTLGKRFFRRANKTQAQVRPSGGGNAARNRDDFVPADVWNNMSREQQMAVINRRQARNNQGGGRGGARLPRQYANANRTSAEATTTNEQSAAIRNARANVNATRVFRMSNEASYAYEQSPWSAKKKWMRPIMVVDSATDINVLGYGWKVTKHSGTYVDLVGFHQASGALTSAEIVTAVAVAQFSDGNYRWIGVHNKAWTGEEERTSLLSKYHASANGLWVDDTHKAYGGSQCIIYITEFYRCSSLS